MKFKHFFLGWRTPAFFIAIGLPAAALAASQPEGVGNFQKVDDHVYRGAQPTEQGFKNLAQLGIKTIVDLREPGDRSRIEEKMGRAKKRARSGLSSAERKCAAIRVAHIRQTAAEPRSPQSRPDALAADYLSRRGARGRATGVSYI